MRPAMGGSRVVTREEEALFLLCQKHSFYKIANTYIDIGLNLADVQLTPIDNENHVHCWEIDFYRRRTRVKSYQHLRRLKSLRNRVTRAN